MRIRLLSATIFSCLALALPLPALSQIQDLIKPPERVVAVQTVAFSPDGRFLAAGAKTPEENGEVVIWDAKTQKVHAVHRTDKGVFSIAFSSDSKLLAVGSLTENCFLIDTETGKLKATLAGHGDAARTVAFSPTDQTLAVGGYDGMIRLWNCSTQQQFKSWQAHGKRVYGLAFSPDGKILASGGDDGTACTWDPSTGKRLRMWDDQRTVVYSLAFDLKGQWLASSGNGSIKFRELGSDKVLPNFTTSANCLAVHPSGKSMAVVRSYATEIMIFPTDFRATTSAEAKRIHDLISQWEHDRIEVRDKASEELQRLGWLAEPFLAKTVNDGPSPESRLRARLLRSAIRAPQPDHTLQGHLEGATSCAYSPDGQTLATAARDGFVFLWDTANYKINAKLNWPGGGQ